MKKKKATPEYLQELGFSKETAKFLLEKIDPEEFIDVLEDNSYILRKWLSSEEIRGARATHAKHDYAREFFDFLGQAVPDDAIILRAYDNLSKNEKSGGEGEELEKKSECRRLLEKVKENPYIIAEHIGFEAADTLFDSKGDPLSQTRVKAAILEVLRNCRYTRNAAFSELNGGMYAPESLLREFVAIILNLDIPDSTFTKAISSLFLEGEIHISRKGENGAPLIYPIDLARIEFGIARNVCGRLKKGKKEIPNLSRIIERAEAELGILLSNEQARAVRMALTSPISIITGGPGTGKTSVQKVLIESFEWATKCQPVRLIAPTGQAAKRMTDSTGYPASTIHKALNLMAGQTTIEDNIVLDDGLIIIDESSMVDAELFNLLLSAISDDTTIVIAGDVNQLPSIGVGCVLKELISAESMPCTTLTKVFRQANDSPIAYNAARIKNGETSLIENEAFRFIEVGDKAEDFVRSICDEYKAAVERDGLDNVICLTAFRKYTETGVNSLNISLRNTLRDDITDSTPYVTVGNGTRAYAGDKIVFGKNTGNLVNGDLGKISEIINSKCARCTFGDREVVLAGANLENVDLAYAQTVHKAQGAEFKTTLLVSDKKQQRLLFKEMIYTGITRSKIRCIIICDKREDSFLPGVARSCPSRNSNLRNLVRV